MEKKSVFKRFLYSQKAAPYVFILPFILTFFIFFAYPIVSTIMMSFQRVAGDNTTFVGLKNYKTLMNSSKENNILFFYMHILKLKKP